MPIESVTPSSHCILCPLLLLPPIPPSIRVFSNESTLPMRWPKYWSFSFSISPCNEHPGLISFRMDWLDLLAVQWTLKSLLQHHSSKASIFQHSAFFTVQLSHPYMTNGKTKWALGSIIINKTSGGDGIPAELFQILNDDAVKVLAALNMPANLENSAVATRLKKVSFHSNPEEGQCQRMFKSSFNCTHFTC